MKIKLHYSLAFVLVLCFFTRLILEFIIFLGIIILHELGHIIMTLIFKQKIKQITLTALGGVVEIKFKKISIPKQFLINIAGIGVNFLMILLVKNINFPYQNLILNYNKLLIIFNLMPIYPLDGYRILSNLTEVFFKPRRQFRIIIFTSFVILGLFIYYSITKFSLAFLIIALYLLHKNIVLLLNQDYFILQKLLYAS